MYHGALNGYMRLIQKGSKAFWWLYLAEQTRPFIVEEGEKITKRVTVGKYFW